MADDTTGHFVRQVSDPRVARAHKTDIHVGLRVRTRRKALGISQPTLAAAIGITFQQVQKYERGSNRISASKLVDIARALTVAPAWFFDGLSLTADDGATTAGGADPVAAFLLTPQGVAMARACLAITARQLVAALSLVESMAPAKVAAGREG